jgi:hypothetical protein
MAEDPSQARAASDDGLVEREIGSLALSEIDGSGAMALMRAVSWNNVLARLGIAAPLVVVHDIGCLVAGIGRPSALSRGLGDPKLGESWRELLVEFADADVVRTPAGWKHRDEMVGVVLARILRSVVPQLPQEIRVRRARELPVDVARYARMDPGSAYSRYEHAAAQAWLRTLTGHRLLPLLEIEQIDVDALRLLGLFPPSAGVGGVDLVDLYNAIVDTQSSDIVDFSLELLPSLLEVRRETGQQTFGVDGYASIERVGNVDNLVLTQLAFDDDVFEQRVVDRELFYYAHAKQIETERRVHHVLVDGSASMRGVREVFARGLALALCKRLALLGEEVRLRFFDSRLYAGVTVGGTGQSEVTYALQFRSERGRNYAHVIRQLNAELSAPARGEAMPLVYLLTHGECELPLDEVQRLAGRAPIYGVYILPRRRLDLGYLDLLHRVHVVDEDSLSHGRRATRAREIISEFEGDLDRRRRAG